jgi:glycosyltransferase involved in cell wall biosynthesis
VLRKAAIAGAWLVVGVPSCLARVRSGDVVHVEGRFRPALLLPLVLGARVRRARVVFAPHTTFSRRTRRGEERLVRWMSRRADTVLAFCEPDRRRIEGWGARAVAVPMMFGPLPVDAKLVARWRERWAVPVGQSVMLFAGQLRADKGPDLLVRAGALSEERLVPAFVGEDHGALGPVRRLAADLDVPLRVSEGYHPIDEFLAALCAADVVVCPYRLSSQSGVLAVAAALGLRTVATDVGGLPELANVVVPPEDPGALARGVARALRHDRQPPRPPPDVRPYLEVYGFDRLAGRR